MLHQPSENVRYKTGVIRYLELAKTCHPAFASLKTDNDFKDYWEDPDFLRLFMP